MEVFFQTKVYMVHKTLTVILVTLIVYLDVSLRGLKERLDVLDKETTRQQQLIDTHQNALLNHQTFIKVILKRLKDSII